MGKLFKLTTGILEGFYSIDPQESRKALAAIGLRLLGHDKNSAMGSSQSSPFFGPVGRMPEDLRKLYAAFAIRDIIPINLDGPVQEDRIFIGETGSSCRTCLISF